MKKVLVPCDFSQQSASAFRFALALPGRQVSVHLMHIVELPVMQDPLIMPALSFEKETLNEMKAVAFQRSAQLAEKYAPDGVNVKTEVTVGRVLPMLIDYIRKKRIDLVIMGTRGASGLRELVIGSNAEKMVRQSPVPVIAIKKFTNPASIRDIVFPQYHERGGERQLVRRVQALQQVFKATVHLLYVNTPAYFTPDTVSVERLKEFARRYAFRKYTVNVFNDRHEENGIMNFAHRIGAGLIAMGTRGRKGLIHGLTGSIAGDIVNHIDCPVWTFVVPETD